MTKMVQAHTLFALLSATLVMPVWAADAPAKEAPAPVSNYTLTYNVGAATDYIVRGLTQTNSQAAVQGGVDYVHASGLYMGLWGSNVSWVNDSGAIQTGDGGNANLEVDTYLGFKNVLSEDWSYDAGWVRYHFLGSYAAKPPAARADTEELYFGATYRFLTVKYSQSLLDGFLTTAGTRGTNYLDATMNFPVADTGITLGLHYGKQTFVGTTTSNGFDLSYQDYRLSAVKDFGGYLLGLAYTSTNASEAWKFNDKHWGKTALVLSLVHSF